MSGGTRDTRTDTPDPEPFPSYLGDSEGRTGLWKPGDGGFDSHLPDHGGEII